jgi:hypothetical protein
VGNALVDANHVAFRQGLPFVFRVRQKKGTQAGSQVNHDIHPGISNPVYYLLEQQPFPTARASFRITHMDMCH